MSAHVFLTMQEQEMGARVGDGGGSWPAALGMGIMTHTLG